MDDKNRKDVLRKHFITAVHNLNLEDFEAQYTTAILNSFESNKVLHDLIWHKKNKRKIKRQNQFLRRMARLLYQFQNYCWYPQVCVISRDIEMVLLPLLESRLTYTPNDELCKELTLREKKFSLDLAKLEKGNKYSRKFEKEHKTFNFFGTIRSQNLFRNVFADLKSQLLEATRNNFNHFHYAIAAEILNSITGEDLVKSDSLKRYDRKKRNTTEEKKQQLKNTRCLLRIGRPLFDYAVPL